jgi:hypothetical protein
VATSCMHDAMSSSRSWCCAVPRAEVRHAEGPTALSDALVTEEHGTAVVELNGKGDHGEGKC